MSTRARPKPPEVLLTLAAVAQIAGVSPAAVSNWRARFPDFPEPAFVIARSPAFREREVRAWLRAHGRAARAVASA